MRILIIDDHALFREGLSNLIARDFENAEITEASSLAVAQNLPLTERCSFDFLLLDLGLGDVDESQVTANAIALFPDIPVIVLSGTSDTRLVAGAIEAGAMGFIPKSLGYREFSCALKFALSGEIYLPKKCIDEGLLLLRKGRPQSTIPENSSDREVSNLSLRQLEILRLLGHGLSNKKISRSLAISENTVKTHMSRIFQTLCVHSRSEAVYLLAQNERSTGRETDI
jgi:two-component system, NarL family, nitrate/nitrite response regulator NarL